MVDIARESDAPPPEIGDPSPAVTDSGAGAMAVPESASIDAVPVSGAHGSLDDPGPAGAASPVAAPPGLRGSMSAFRSRNFRLFWFGAIISSTGNWVQAATVPFVIYEITQSALWVGIAGFMQFAPFVVTGPIGGSLADRFQRRTILIITQSMQAMAALSLWAMWSAGVRAPVAILGLVFINGLIAGLTIPSWQAFVSELVPREDLLNAVTLNSAQFNAARAFGPAIGGFFLGLLGASWAFLLNGLSFAAVILALFLISVPVLVKQSASEHGGIMAGFRESVRYARRRPGIWVCLIVVFALGGLGSPMIQFLPVFAEKVYDVGGIAYGFLGAAAGFGAILGTPLVVGPGSRLPRSRLTAIAMLVYGLAIVAFGLVSVYGLALLALVVTGAGYLAIASTLNTTVQLQVDEVMRGKVLAVYVMVLTTALPLGVLAQGAMAQFVGPQFAVVVFGVGFLAVWAWLRFGGGDHLAAMDADPPIVR